MVVYFSLGSVFEAVECIQVYYTTLYRTHGSTDMTSKTMRKITLCIICNALYTVAKRKVKFLTNGNSLCSVFRNKARSELDKIGLNAASY